MEKRSTKSLLIINAAILLVILFTLTSREPEYVYTNMDSNVYGEASQYNITHLSENTILLVNNQSYSGDYGKMTVLEYDPERNMFFTISDYHHIFDFESDLGYDID